MLFPPHIDNTDGNTVGDITYILPAHHWFRWEQGEHYYSHSSLYIDSVDGSRVSNTVHTPSHIDGTDGSSARGCTPALDMAEAASWPLPHTHTLIKDTAVPA